YHRLRRTPKWTIREIGDYLGVPLDSKQISRIHNEMAFENLKEWSSTIGDDPSRTVARLRDMTYDVETSFHRNHIRDGRSGNGRRMLTPGQRWLVRELLQRHGRR